MIVQQELLFITNIVEELYQQRNCERKKIIKAILMAYSNEFKYAKSRSLNIIFLAEDHLNLKMERW